MCRLKIGSGKKQFYSRLPVILGWLAGIVLLLWFGRGILVILMMMMLFSGNDQPVHPHSELLRKGHLIGWLEEEILLEIGEPDKISERSWYDLGPNGKQNPDRAIMSLYFYNGHELSMIEIRHFPAQWTEQLFDAEKWREASPEERLSMACDLYAGERLIGLSPSEVYDILGPPTGYRREIIYEDSNHHFFDPILGIHLVLDEDGFVVDRYFSDY